MIFPSEEIIITLIYNSKILSKFVKTFKLDVKELKIIHHPFFFFFRNLSYPVFLKSGHGATQDLQRSTLCQLSAVTRTILTYDSAERLIAPAVVGLYFMVEQREQLLLRSTVWSR